MLLFFDSNIDLQICSVKPDADIDECFQELNIPEAIRTFYVYNNVCRFQLDRPYFVGEKTDNEIMVTCFA